MTEFYFGTHCTFCQSRIGSTHCLLPYQLVIGYNAPKDETSKIIDITEIHMRYGLEMLQTNLESISWIKARPCSMQSSIYPTTNRSDSNRWSDQMNSLDEAMATQATSTSNAIANFDSESNYSDYIASQLDENQLQIEDQQRSESDNGAPLHAVAPATGPTYADVVEIAITSESTSDARLPVIKPQAVVDDKCTSKSQAQQKYDTEPSRDSRNHLIDDLVIMAKAAFNIHACQRDWIKVSSLKESIMHESDIRSRMGAKYNPSKNTSLDGDKALAKEIIATHGSQEIQQWESGECTLRESFCLLNCKFASLGHDNCDDLRLCEELIRNFQMMIKSQVYNEGYLPAVINAVKFALSKDGHSSTLEWMKNRSKFLGTKIVSRSSTPSDSGKGKASVRKTDPYPATDERLIDYINVHLQVHVNRAIENANDEVPQMNDGIKPEKFFFKLASEFLRRNKGWHNENSFTSSQHLVKLEELTGMKSQSSEASLTFFILKNVIDSFRIAFKQRYPRTTPTKGEAS